MMRYLFGQEGRAALDRLLASSPLLAFDFDGTIAPIVDLPEQARVPDDIAALLAAMQRLHPVAIVTGRAVADVTARLGFRPEHVIGNHGAEDGLAPGSSELEALEATRRVFAARSDELMEGGVMVEDKGRSLALHYRLAADPALAERCIAKALEALPPDVRVFGGKMCANVVWARAADKGVAVERLAGRLRRDAVFFAGDDVTDESVYARAPISWLTVRVGRNSSSRARYFVHEHEEMPLLLELMLDRVTNA